MRTKTLMPVALACALLVSAVAQAAPVLVYGNMGPTGTTNLGDSGSDFGPSAATLKILAQGFTSGTDLLQVTSVTLGAYSAPVGNRTVSIYANIGGNPGGAPLYTSSQTSVGGKGPYAFSFSNAVLAPSTSYWIVPQFDVDWFWYTALDENQPDGLNASGYAFLGTRRSGGNMSGTWNNTNQPYNVSISAINPVPEPSSIALAGVGIVVAGFSLRRRMRRAPSTEATETT
jgi:hypothetical protein